MININNLIEDLNKVDIHFNLPIGTTANAIAYHQPAAIQLLNEKVNNIIAVTGVIDKKDRPAWTELMVKLNVSRAWWLCGDPSIDESSHKIEVI